MAPLFKKLYFLTALLVMVCHVQLHAQASFSAKISPGSIGKNETAELRLMVDNAKQVDEITPPSLKDFSIVSGPNQESGMESNNGVTRQYVGITYLLKPRSTGRFTIAGAVAKADGKILKGNPVTLEVSKNATGNTAANTSSLFGALSPFAEPAAESSFNDYILKKGENVSDKINKNIFIKVEVNKTSCFVGEPVIVTYKLYTRLKSESSITKNPSFNGFSVIDLLPPGNTYYSVEKLNGREYNVYILRKSQLYPLQAGPVELESAEVDNNIHFIKEAYLNTRRDMLDDMFRDFAQTSIPAEGMQDEKVTLQSKPAIITVKPLPEAEKPPVFKGAVGNFTMEANLEKSNFTSDDAGKLTIAISGAGNMPLINAPDISWPEGIEPYEVRAKEQLDKLSVPVKGTKYFEYPFIVGKPGEYVIPSVAFSFFDVKEGKYKTAATRPLILTVKKGNGKRKVAAPEGETVKTEKGQFLDILFTNRWLIILPLVIMMLTGLFIWLRKDHKKARFVPAPVIPPAVENMDTRVIISVNPLQQSEEKLASQDSRGFYESLNKELRTYLSDKLDIPLPSLGKKAIADQADKKGVAIYTALQIQQLLDEIEWQLYTPFAAEDKMQAMYNNADSIVQALKTIA